MADISRHEVIKYLERKRKAYQNRLDKCKTENRQSEGLTYELRIKPVSDLLIYLNKVDSIVKQKFIKRVEQKRNEYRKARDAYEARGQDIDAANCEISILPLENLIRHIMVGNLDVESTEQKEDSGVPEKSGIPPRTGSEEEHHEPERPVLRGTGRGKKKRRNRAQETLGKTGSGGNADCQSTIG